MEPVKIVKPGDAATGHHGSAPARPGSPPAPRAAVFRHPQPELAAIASGGPIRLRALRESDLDAIISACQDPLSQRWTSLPESYSRGDAEFYVRQYSRGRWTRGEGAVFAVTGPDDAFAGSMDLRLSPTDPELADVGYLTAPAFRGRGYAPAALRAVCEWGFDALGLTRIEWRAFVGNKASRRVAEKAGFTVEGVAHAAVTHRGAKLDEWVGALLAADRSGAKADGTREPR